MQCSSTATGSVSLIVTEYRFILLMVEYIRRSTVLSIPSLVPRPSSRGLQRRVWVRDYPIPTLAYLIMALPIKKLIQLSVPPVTRLIYLIMALTIKK